MKVCSKCGGERPDEHFQSRRESGGVVRTSRVCRACKVDAQRKRRRAKVASAAPVVASSARIVELAQLDRPYLRVTPLPTAEELADWYRKGCRIA